jgi:hypothetical protein
MALPSAIFYFERVLVLPVGVDGSWRPNYS